MPRWNYKDVEYDKIDVSLIKDNKFLFNLLTIASFIEITSDVYDKNLSIYYQDNKEVVDWLNSVWKIEEVENKIKKIDEKLAQIRKELEPLEVEILKVSSELKNVQEQLHLKLNKVKRVRKLYLKESDPRKLEQLDKDYDQLMKDIHKVDKKIKELKEKYEELVEKEDKLLKEEMELEHKKANLYHEREMLMKQAERLMSNLSNKIKRVRV